MGYSIKFLGSWATPLPNIAGPEALRPILSKGLPFSRVFYCFLFYRNGSRKPLELFSGKQKKMLECITY